MALGSLVLVAGLALALAPPGADRELVLVARQMAYFTPGGVESNPTIRVRAGERVRIVLVNEDRGMLHDLSIGSLGFRVEALAGDGSRGAEILRVPEAPGRTEYVCTFHARLMRGVLEVLPPGDSTAEF